MPAGKCTYSEQPAPTQNNNSAGVMIPSQPSDKQNAGQKEHTQKETFTRLRKIAGRDIVDCAPRGAR